MPIERRRIIVKGVVQGVGFRPFIYRLAVEHDLGGSVCNRGSGDVEIVVEGEAASVASFLRDLRDRPPPLAQIDFVESSILQPIGESLFLIGSSQQEGAGAGAIPPDIAICENCRRDLYGKTRYREYWATNCTNCGPRFTVIESLPYDRPRTSMRSFPMCSQCEAEYTNPSDRRYHAQTIACPRCGPRLTFDGSSEGPIEQAAAALRLGRIVAIKGIGGTHLACNARDDEAVERLREQLGRPFQPFAVMATEAGLPAIAEVSDLEWEALRSPRRPIVLLPQRRGILSAFVAPRLHTVGVMLPYSGLHYLLLDRMEGALVMTSANRPSRPMLVKNAEILTKLRGVADHFLLHDRQIVARCDDSILRKSAGTMTLLRRSRGYVPQPIRLELGGGTILALGAETALAFALYTNNVVTLSQHIGAVDNLETYTFLNEAIEHLYRLTGAAPAKTVVCDLHPAFLTTRHAEMLAEQSGATLIRAQHHEAHLASVMGEHALDEAVGIVLDGFGYGRDGNAWGGEVFLAKGGEIQRVGSLTAVPLPGGDLAVRHPLRMTASFLHQAGVNPEEIARFLHSQGLSTDEIHVIFGQLETGWNTVLTTSAGRYLDAVAAFLGVCQERTYEGEPAMCLETAAIGGDPIEVRVGIKEEEGRLLLDTVHLFAQLVDLAKTERAETVAATAQVSLAKGVARIALEVAKREGGNAVALSGGVTYNDAISTTIRKEVEKAGCSLFLNEQVPCGDGGVAFGQVVLAARSVRWLSGTPRPDTTARK
jgi:hydrogenase maturation protein HypF